MLAIALGLGRLRGPWGLAPGTPGPTATGNFVHEPLADDGGTRAHDAQSPATAGYPASACARFVQAARRSTEQQPPS